MISHSAIDFRVLFESVPGLYLILLPDLTIVAVSDSYLDATMTKRIDILGRNLFDVFPDNPDDSTASGVLNLRASLNYVIQYGVSHTMAVQKYDIRRPDGAFEERFWSPLNKPVFNTDNELAWIIHRVEDVTDFILLKKEEVKQLELTNDLRTRVDEMKIETYKRAQEIQQINKKLLNEMDERRKSEEKFRSLLEAAPDAMVITNKKGKIVLINRQAEILFGYTKDELSNQRVEILVPFAFRDKHLQHRSGYYKDPKMRAMGEGFELYAQRKDGTQFPVEISLSPLEISEDMLISAAIRDISLRKEAEEKIRLMNMELEKRVAEKTKEAIEKEQQYRFLLENMREGIQVMTLI